MARPLTFQYAGDEYASGLTKVDRAKLYGYKEVEVVDEDGDPCELATLAGDGQTIIGRGGTAVGYMSPDGMWRERQQLRPVNLEGDPIEPADSSFSHTISLSETVTVDEYLDYDIRLVYLLADLPREGQLHEELKKGTIFRVSFSYRGGVEAEPAFLLANANGDPFLLVGRETRIELLTLRETAEVIEEEEEESAQEGELMDFDMI